VKQQVKKKISYAELEAAFPWVRFLPPLAQREFMNAIDSYRSAADTYARQVARGSA
jgi:hypothetical protein